MRVFAETAYVSNFDVTFLVLVAGVVALHLIRSNRGETSKRRAKLESTDRPTIYNGRRGCGSQFAVRLDLNAPDATTATRRRRITSASFRFDLDVKRGRRIAGVSGSIGHRERDSV